MIPISQFDEATIVRNYFGDYVGFCVDIGCSNGVSLSNSFQLGLQNWKLLLVEASPIHFQGLLRNYIHRGNVQFVNGALWHERKLMKFNYNEGFYSSLIYKEEAGLFMAQYWVNTITPADLAAIQPECDFLSIDIEGADLLVFPSLMAAYPKCRLVCVEHAANDTIKSQWHDMFARYGFAILAETPENYIAKRV